MKKLLGTYYSDRERLQIIMEHKINNPKIAKRELVWVAIRPALYTQSFYKEVSPQQRENCDREENRKVQQRQILQQFCR